MLALGVFCCDPKRPPGLGVEDEDPNKPPGFGVSDLVPNNVDEPNLEGCPKTELWGAGEVTNPNLEGAGVVVGVVDSGLWGVGNNEPLGLAGVS